MSQTRLEIAAVLLALLLPLAQAGGSDQDDRDQLLQALDEIRRESNVAGLGLVLVDADGPEWCETLGLADRESGRPLGGNDYIRIGSITKAFTGLTLLAAAREDGPDLDAPIATLVEHPPLENRWVPDRRVTIAQLLEHTAGLRDLSKKEWDFNDPVSLDDALRVDPGSRRLAWPPNLASSYSNSGAGVAAWVFEQVTGDSFEAAVERHVFEPLGLKSATFERTSAVRSGLAVGYDRDGRSVIPYWHQLYRPFGAINVRLCEMGSFVRLFLNEGRHESGGPFTAAEIERLETPATGLAPTVGLGFGYGFGNYAYTHEGFVFRGHGGDADGYLSFFGYSRELERGYFIVINAFQNRTLGRLRDLIEDHLVGSARPSFEPPVPQPADHLASLAGRYDQFTARFGEPRGSVTVSFEEGRLWLIRGERRQALLPMSRWTFRRRFEPVATTAFVRHGEDVHLQGPFGNYVRRGGEPEA